MAFFYIANWKNFFLPQQEIDFVQKHQNMLITLSASHNIIICPSFLSISQLTSQFADTAVSIGAQSSSQYSNGPYTGEITAQNLAALGCQYALVGHLERRTLFGETNEIIAQKIDQLLANGIMPIICVGSSKKQEESGILAKDIITAQLALPITLAQKHQLHKLLIAYEPGSSIGSGNAANPDEISAVFLYIKQLFNSVPSCAPVLLYGGSVNEKNCHELRKIDQLDGFLIGSASTNFQTFEKIVSCS